MLLSTNPGFLGRAGNGPGPTARHVESGPDREGGIPVSADLAGTVRYIFDGERVTLLEGDDLAVFVDLDFDFIDPKQGLIEVNKRNLPTYKFDEFGKWAFDGRVITTSL